MKILPPRQIEILKMKVERLENGIQIFENNMGGWTVIANRNQYCGGMSMYDGYAFGKGLFTRFCWIKRGDSILAVLEDGETRVWPIQSFELMSVEPDINNQL
jgi:hypothetical protein